MPGTPESVTYLIVDGENIDGDFLPHIDQLLRSDRQVGVVGFEEFLNAGFADLNGLQLFDIEEDAGCFTSVLPRVRIIDLDSFNPERFLESSRAGRHGQSCLDRGLVTTPFS